MSQAELFGRYLLHTNPSKETVELFNKAMQITVGDADKTDAKLLALIQKRPYVLSCVDAALALIKPNSEVRRRIYVMFSILESSPEYHEHFLPKKHSPLFIFALLAVGVRAVIRAVVGIVIVKAVAR